ncbi:MAG: exodeoxyribonuclease VII large subunit [Clostridia bacterium]|nr:exodeoxyribonuclease VII large subunit [Clostridia bacterium]
MQNSAISVKQLNMYVKSLVESDKRLNYVSVVGEISNFKSHYSSGHWYFTVKDSDASVRCVMFKGSNSRVTFLPKDGERVIISGRVSIYEKDGQYQFYAESMVPYGEGDLAFAFKLCKEKLEKEGLFDESSKRPINRMPKRIAVVTSDTGAAVHDICSTLENRMPSCEIVLCPVAVQGENAVSSIIKTLDRVYALSGIDTVIIGRGGGSNEDLAPFNNEMLARKVFESPFPVISAVGHETDFTICDFVADIRAATPTAAAITATFDASETAQKITENKNKLQSAISVVFEKYKYRLQVLMLSAALKKPTEIIDRKLQTVDSLTAELKEAFSKPLREAETKLYKTISKLDALSPLKTLNRGYAFAQKGEKPITGTGDVGIGDEISLRFTDGSLRCLVKEKSNGKI